MTQDELGNKIGMQINLTVHSGESVESTINRLKEIAIDYGEQFKYDYSKECKCGEDTPGQTWCCNLCGLPTSVKSIYISKTTTENGCDLIVKERERQIKELGYNDELYSHNELANAAICYALHPSERDMENDDGVSLNIALWPWDKVCYKPSPDNRIKELTKAGALIAAQIDYLINWGQRI